jgi:parallel beta-helix repeat protein
MDSSRHARLAALAACSIITLIAFGWASPAGAANCGGSVPCRCGDTVVRATTLAGDLGVCEGIGLKVSSGVVLDCAGHTLTGSDLSGAKYGIHLTQAVGAEVRNCRVTKFRRAIRVEGGEGNRIVGNEAFGNKYGVELAGAARGTLIEGNAIHDNRDEGIHVGTGAHRTEIRQNTLVKNKNEAIYLLRANGCQVVGNSISRTDNAAIFIKHSRNTYVADNAIVNGRVHLRGNSVDNVLENNHLRGNGYFFQGFEEPLGTWTFPHDNLVRGGIVENTSSTCLRFAGAYDNRVEALHVDDECEVSMWAVGGQEPTGNVIELLPLP